LKETEFSFASQSFKRLFDELLKHVEYRNHEATEYDDEGREEPPTRTETKTLCAVGLDLSPLYE
ncbi:hypothetical protein PV327_011076, partial [Microctonus hyperodae]